MKFNYNTLISLLIYVVSIGALTLTDFLVIKYLSTENIAEWAFIKSVIFICGGLCVLGFDQLLLREVNQYKNFKKQFLIQSILISFIVSILLYFYTKLFFKSFILFLILFFYSYSLFEAGYWRGKSNLVLSQLNTNSWKILVFILTCIALLGSWGISVLHHFFYSFILSFIFLFLLNFKLRTNYEKIENLNRAKRIEYFLLGFYFFVHSFSLVIANYGEQFLINIFGYKELSKEIFSYITIYSSLVLAGVGFVGFYLGPKVRYKKIFRIRDYGKYQLLVVGFGLFLLLFNSALVYLVYPYLVDNIAFDVFLWVLIFILTFIRILYVLPSLCLGVFGTAKSLKKSSIYSLVLVSLYIILLCLVLKFNVQYLNYLTVILMILHWFGKLLVANYYVLKSLEVESP